jgi:hypothetical protein
VVREGAGGEARSMSALPSAGGGYGALHLVLPGAGCNGTAVSSELLAPTAAASSVANKRKRRPAGTPGTQHSSTI